MTLSVHAMSESTSSPLCQLLYKVGFQHSHVQTEECRDIWQPIGFLKEWAGAYRTTW